MPRKRKYSDSLLAHVRQYFNIEQQDLARYLGVSRGLVAHIEAGRRGMSDAVFRRLTPLAEVVPDAPAPSLDNAAASAEPVPLIPAPAFLPLEARRDYCQHTAGQLRRALRPYAARVRYAARWQAVLPTLLAALPPLPPDPAAPAPHSVEATYAAFMRRWLPAQAPAFTPAEIAEWHLLRVRAEALEAEATALTAIIAAGTTPPA